MKILNSLFLVLFSGSLFANTNQLGCEAINFANHKGQTYLSFLETTLKPAMDDFAINGYKIAGREQVLHTLEHVSGKVRWKVLKSARTQEKLLNIVDALEGQTADLYTLPDMIASVDPSVSRYTISTFLGLASCGGAVVEYAPGHISYNIHYGTGSEAKDERTGRSFGEADERYADDASHKNYLRDTGDFGEQNPEQMFDFYQAIIKSLANSDASDMNKLSDLGKLVVTDFLAVYSAEQVRNLMDGRLWLHWDAAMLEVTLLSSFHSGQDKMKLFYKNPVTGEQEFTSEVYDQENGCSTNEDRKLRQAKFYDYWQFSSSTNPEHCNRSGINITKKEFRKLGELITKYEMEHNPALINKVFELTGKSPRSTPNVYKQLSKLFINSKTEKELGEEFSNELAKAYAELMVQVQKDAKKITTLLENGQLK